MLSEFLASWRMVHSFFVLNKIRLNQKFIFQMSKV